MPPMGSKSVLSFGTRSTRSLAGGLGRGQHSHLLLLKLHELLLPVRFDDQRDHENEESCGNDPRRLASTRKELIKSNNKQRSASEYKKKKKGDRKIDSRSSNSSEGRERRRDARAATSRLVTAVSYLLRRLQDPLLDATVLLARTRTRAHDLGHDSLSLSLSHSIASRDHTPRARFCPSSLPSPPATSCSLVFSPAQPHPQAPCNSHF